MPDIYSYTKVVNETTTKQIDMSGIEGAVELCEIDGITYVSIPDAASVAKQDAAIDAKVATIDAKKKEEIRTASYVVKFIKQQVRDKIREKYELDDELKLLRLRDTNKDEWDKYNAHAESCRAWGEAEIAKLGI